MNAFKEKCISLRKAGYTLPEIVERTGRSKTSVYFHIKGIPLSKEKEDEIRRATGDRARKNSLKRKGVSTKNFRRFAEWTPGTVTLLGHLTFDGTINRAGCIYNNRNISLLKKVEVAMREIYKHEPKRYTNTLTGVQRIAYHNVELGNYLKGKRLQLIKDISTLPRELKVCFLKTFFDDEGCIDYRPHRNLRQVRGYQKDTKILELVKILLGNLDIESRVILPNEIVISGKENLKKFQKEINFSPGVRVNGNRTNSSWKKSNEKGVLLDQAIKSFKN